MFRTPSNGHGHGQDVFSEDSFDMTVTSSRRQRHVSRAIVSRASATPVGASRITELSTKPGS